MVLWDTDSKITGLVAADLEAIVGEMIPDFGYRYSTVQDMQDMLSAYDLSKNSVEINKDAPEWTHFSVWNRKYMDPLPGNDLRSMWQACEPAIGRKIAASYDIRVNDIRRCVGFVNTLPPPSAPESPFFLTLGTPAQQQCPPRNSTLAQRTKEEWARTLCENKAVAIIQRMQGGVRLFAVASRMTCSGQGT